MFPEAEALIEDLSGYIDSRCFDADTHSKLFPKHIWCDAIRVLFHLDCIDEEPFGYSDPKVLILTEEPVQAQVLSEWLVMSKLVHRYLGKTRPGWRGNVRTDAGSVRIMLRSDFNEAWVYPVATVPSQTSFDLRSHAYGYMRLLLFQHIAICVYAYNTMRRCIRDLRLFSTSANKDLRK